MTVAEETNITSPTRIQGGKQIGNFWMWLRQITSDRYMLQSFVHKSPSEASQEAQIAWSFSNISWLRRLKCLVWMIIYQWVNPSRKTSASFKQHPIPHTLTPHALAPVNVVCDTYLTNAAASHEYLTNPIYGGAAWKRVAMASKQIDDSGTVD